MISQEQLELAQHYALLGIEAIRDFQLLVDAEIFLSELAMISDDNLVNLPLEESHGRIN